MWPRVLPVLLALAGVAHPPAAPGRERAAIAQLPEFARVESRGPTTLVLRGRLPTERREAVEARARAVVHDAGVRFLAEAGPKPAVDVCLFETTRDFQAFSRTVVGEQPSELGFYDPRLRVVVVHLGYGLRNMSHEIVHALIDDDFPRIPPWLAEGLGALYGGSDATARGIRFHVNYRHRDVRAALDRGGLPTLAELASARREEVYGANAMVFYGYARDVLLFLESKGQLSSFYVAVRSGVPPDAALASRATDAQFARFARGVREGQVVEPRP